MWDLSLVSLLSIETDNIATKLIRISALAVFVLSTVVFQAGNREALAR